MVFLPTSTQVGVSRLWRLSTSLFVAKSLSQTCNSSSPAFAIFTRWFVSDFATLALDAPELSEKTIYKTFIYVGESVRQKNIFSALRSVLERDKVLHDANV